MRFRGVDWSNDHLALLTEARWSDRRIALLALNPSITRRQAAVTLYEGSSQDRYHSPGRPMLTQNASGHEVLELTPDGNAIYFASPGATPKGEQPFVATMPIIGGQETILFRSSDPYFADPIALLADNKLLVRRESVTDPPNYFAVPIERPSHRRRHRLPPAHQIPQPLRRHQAPHPPAHPLQAPRRRRALRLPLAPRRL